MKITKTAGWSLGTAGLCVAITAGSWFGLVAPQRAEAAEARSLTAAAVTQNAQLVVQIQQLEQQYAELPTRQAELAAIRLALPEEPGLAQLIRDVNARSTEAGVVLDSVTTGAPAAVVDAGALAAPVTPEPSEEPSSESSSEPSAAPSTPPSDPGAVGQPVTPGATQQPVLAALPVVVTGTGDFASTTLLLKLLQADLPRALLVDSVALSLVDGDENASGTVQTVVTGRVFVFVDPTEIPVVTDLPDATPSPSSDG